MRCPFCGADDTQVKDSRPTEDRGAIRRRRFCPNCAARFTTFERVQLRELTVVKKNGQREPFERDKLYTITLESDGGLNLTASPLKPIYREALRQHQVSAFHGESNRSRDDVIPSASQ